LRAGKKRRSGKTAKSNDDDNDDEIVVNNNNDSNNIGDMLNGDEQSLQNGHFGAKMENVEEEADVVSDLPVYGRLRKPSRTKTPLGD